MVDLSPQQTSALDTIKDWYAGTGDGFGADVFPLFGYAGTGKTTMAKAIPEALGLERVRYGTFTGKAAHVLRGKGASPVSTIHSAIYFPTASEEAKEALHAAREELADLRADDQAVFDGTQALREQEIGLLEVKVTALEADARRLSWEWNPDSEWSQAELIILDEVSMVGSKLAADIEAYEVPIIVLGDPAQLPPIEGGGHYTQRTPAFLLDEVHRQALDSPVLNLATRIRNSATAGLGLNGDDKREASVREAMEADQVLVWSNKRRWSMINAMRRKLGRPDGQVVAGDRIMCLTNNKDLAIFNGQQFDVLGVEPGELGPTLTLTDRDNGVEKVIPVYADGFAGQDEQVAAKNSGAGMRGNRMLATFAQAITVHKAQGSQWDSVYIVDETPTMIWAAGKREGQQAAVSQARQWMYTAVTRAADRVTVGVPPRR
jgi:exodeoxyribonuclease-5